VLTGRDFALPDDVKELAEPVLAHRLFLTADARLRGQTPEGVVAALLEAVAVPVEDDAAS
jgi:MoxR-like ATPase